MKTMTEIEKEQFVTEFYELWKEEFPFDSDIESPNPWGCPWLFGHEVNRQSAKDYFGSVKAEIIEINNQ